MLISNNWVQVTTGTGLIIQKHGPNPLSLCYHTAEPTTQDTFGLTHRETQLYPLAAGLNIYVRAVKGDVEITVQSV